MPDILKALSDGGNALTVETIESGYIIAPTPGRDADFNVIARVIIERSGIDYSAFPRLDGRGGFESIQLIPHKPA